MNQKELTKTLIMISNWKKPFGPRVFLNIWALLESISSWLEDKLVRQQLCHQQVVPGVWPRANVFILWRSWSRCTLLVLSDPSLTNAYFLIKILHAVWPQCGITQQTQGVYPLLVQWWASVADDGPTLYQHWVNTTTQWNTKHLHSIYTMLEQRRRRWADVV